MDPEVYAEDRVLVAYVPSPADFALIQEQGWYRIPYQQAPKGVYAEWFAFYFGAAFGARKWAIHAYAPRLGHELVQRCDLLPHQADHPRAQEWYIQVQLGPIQYLPRPIVSLQWRRITFLYTTWDRFQGAWEINDLFLESEEYVDRAFSVLKDGRSAFPRPYSPPPTSHFLKESGPGYAASILY